MTRWDKAKGGRDPLKQGKRRQGAVETGPLAQTLAESVKGADGTDAGRKCKRSRWDGGERPRGRGQGVDNTSGLEAAS